MELKGSLTATSGRWHGEMSGGGQQRRGKGREGGYEMRRGAEEYCAQSTMNLY